MIRYRSLLLLGLGLAWPQPAPAQLSAVVVPAEAGVVIPARGAAPPPAVPQARRTRRGISPLREAPREAPGPEISPLLVALPLTAAAALLAAVLSSGGGGGGGVSAPVRTR